jgi:hypothetical protein
MEFLKHAYEWLMGPNGAILFGVLLGISEALSMIPAVKANGVFQAIYNGLKSIKQKFFTASEAAK